MLLTKLDELNISFTVPGAPPYAPDPTVWPPYYIFNYGFACYNTCSAYPLIYALTPNGGTNEYTYAYGNGSIIFNPALQPAENNPSFYYPVTVDPTHIEGSTFGAITGELNYKSLDFSSGNSINGGSLNDPDGTWTLSDPPPFAPQEGWSNGIHYSNHLGLVAFSVFDTGPETYAHKIGDTVTQIFPFGAGVGRGGFGHHKFWQMASISGTTQDWTAVELDNNTYAIYGWSTGPETITLSDPADDLIFQSFWDMSNPGLLIWLSNSQWMIASCVGDFPITTGYIFLIDKDFTTYRRINVTGDGSASDGMFFVDIDGQSYILGIDAANNGYVQLGTIVPPSPPIPPVNNSFMSSPSLVSYTSSANGDGATAPAPVIGLGCWSPCNNLAVRYPD